jgi:cell division protein FtsW
MSQQNQRRGGENAKELLERQRHIFEGDRTLWVIYAVLLVVSLLVVYSSTAKMAYAINTDLSTSDNLRQQLMLIVMSIMLVFITHKINYTYVRYLTPTLFYLFVILTVATYFVGATTNGAARWLPIFGFQFQPSEGLKIMTILMLAKRIDGFKANINKVNLSVANNREVGTQTSLDTVSIDEVTVVGKLLI